MELTQIITMVTILVTWVLGFLSKKSTWVSNNLIPVQNIIIGLVVALIEWVITKDFSAALALSGLFAGGAYDVVHNLNLIFKGDK